jgi:hypothetical protein
MFIVALLTIAKGWICCPITNEWIREIWSIYTMEYYSAINKCHCYVICRKMDVTGDHYIE